MLIYIPVHLASGLPVGPSLLWALPLLALLLVMATGLAMIVGALQVYFRDLKNFMPYLLRRLAVRVAGPLLRRRDAGEVPLPALREPARRSCSRRGATRSTSGIAPSATQLAVACAWAFGLLIVGFLFFVSREREFAVRL